MYHKMKIGNKADHFIEGQLVSLTVRGPVFAHMDEFSESFMETISENSPILRSTGLATFLGRFLIILHKKNGSTVAY